MTSGDVTPDKTFAFDSRFRSQPSCSLPNEISLIQHNMAAAESPKTDWQITKSSLKERNKHMFNNSLISDVTFSVNNSSAHQQQSALLIPAHKYVLAISSPVFFAMFYGRMADAARTVELADCDSDSFLELLRFVYCDEAELTGRNVIQVLYLAKKYMIPALSEQCTRFLQENLDANNVFVVLPGAQAYEEAALVEKCWETVDRTSEEAMRSEAFLDVSHDLLTAVLERDTINTYEVNICTAVDRWVEHQCKKSGKEVTGENKRELLGDAIYLIRFPTMTQKEFSSVASTTNLLRQSDICEIFFHFNNDLLSPMKFPSARRRGNVSRIRRFGFHDCASKWNYNGIRCDSLAFSVNSDVDIHGVRMYGYRGGEYVMTVGIYRGDEKLAGVIEGCKFEADTNDDSYAGFDVIFAKPAAVKKADLHEIRAVINGPASCRGRKGQTKVTNADVTFSFSNARSDSNGTNTDGGQFPEIVFSRRS